MAGDSSVIVGAQPVEYGEETSFATGLDGSTDYKWFGIGTSWSPEQGVESESVTYLPEYEADNKLEKNVNVKLREMYSGDITYHPQSGFDFLKFWTGKVGGTADDVPTIQIGEVDETNDEYRRLLGGVGEEFSLSVEQDGVAEIDGSFMFAAAEPFGPADYVGDGIVDLANSVTPTNDEISVITSSLDEGFVALYEDNSGTYNELDRVEADSSTAQNTDDLAGSTVDAVQVIKTTQTFTSETLTVYDETDGGGTAETIDVNREGSHASEVTTEPLSYDNLSNVSYGGSSLDGYVESIELSVSNDVVEVRDPDSGRETQIAAIVPVDREVTVDLDITYDSFELVDEIRSYNAQDFKFDLGTTTFTVTGVQFPEAPFEFSPDDLISDSLSSDRASSLSWS